MLTFTASINLADDSVEEGLKHAIYDFLDESGIDYHVVDMRLQEEKIEKRGPFKARTTDPDTSKAAAVASLPRQGTQRDLLLECVVDSESRGLTAEEAARNAGIRLNAASTRMSELVRGEFIKDSGERRKTSGRQPAIVYVADISAIRRASKI